MESSPGTAAPPLSSPGRGRTDCDPASGRGWAALERDGTLSGHIFTLAPDSGLQRDPYLVVLQQATFAWLLSNGYSTPLTLFAAILDLLLHGEQAGESPGPS